MNELPIALTCGEPAGIGPEIAVAARRVLGAEIPFFLIGDPAHLPLGSAIQEITAPRQAESVPAETLPVLPHRFPAPAVPARPDPENAPAVVESIARAVGLVTGGEAGALVTAPISKQALQSGAAFAFPGHTEYLAALAGAKDVAMMLACAALRVVPTTIHIPLSQVPARLTPDLLRRTIRLVHRAMISDFGIAGPRIAVAGLNPHAGEGGTLGHEEDEVITPALDELRAEGLALSGPLPADTMFHEAARARYDVAVAMYHDQALIPIKTLDFSGGVNVTLGLPFVRTSPDHGTAFDIAGQGVADPASLVAALRMARDLAHRRRKARG